ncbi:hypothetical protein LMG29739_06363 [Paraburkholderia solisilvae]|uniref:Uncharacterized protein n=1 Tax=Paraburkholderia solisilvae TaxID=624376 RepID=A0A6J5F7D3_9BURK|nr:hypothetical protein LMG29739_06363 [Paraburkholderia solisilvae]
MLLCRETPRKVRAEFLDQQRDAVRAAALVADRVFDSHFVERRAVAELHGQRVGNRTLVRVVIILRVLRVFHAFDLRAQRVDARILRDCILVVRGGEPPEDQRHRNHVLDAVIAIGRVIQRPFLVDDADGRFVRADCDLRDVLDAFALRGKLRVQRHRRFDRGLRVELGRKRNLEQHVFHHVRTVRTLELECIAVEQHVVEAPRLRTQHRRIAHLAGLRDQREAHRARRGVAGGPRLARAGVRRMAVRAQRVPIDERERHRVDQLVAREADQLADHRGRRELDEQHMIEPDLVERVLERDAALNFVRLDHADQDVFHRQRLFARCDGVARQPVGGGENAAEVIGRMAPFGGEPGVVEVEPADHRADIERGLDRIELE